MPVWKRRPTQHEVKENTSSVTREGGGCRYIAPCCVYIINNDISDCSKGQLSGAPSKYGAPGNCLPCLPHCYASADRRLELAVWCSLNNLELNTLKTVEMIVDFRSITLDPSHQHTPSLNCYRLVDATEL